MFQKKKKILAAILGAVLVGTTVFTYGNQTYSKEAEDLGNENVKLSGEVWIAGDSIAASHSEEDPNAYASFVHGWGEFLGGYLTGEAIVHNLGISGQSAMHYIETDYYKQIMDGIGQGDLLLVQFGHNDYHNGTTHATDSTDTEGSYKWYLKNNYIDKALAVGAIPVLCTSVVLCDYQNFITKNQPQNDFAEAMRELQKEYEEQGIYIGLIDTYCLTETFYNADLSGIKDYFAIKYDGGSASAGGGSTSLDHVHFSEKGAHMAADIISQNLFTLYPDFSRFAKMQLTDGGTGTSNDPYLISSIGQLYRIMQDSQMNTNQTYYKLTKDIMPSMQTQNWIKDFNANLDGDNHTILNPIGSATDSFIDENHGTISNLKLKYNIDHTMQRLSAPFVKDNYGTIKNCSAEGTVSLYYFNASEEDSWFAGTFAGINEKDAVIAGCSNKLSISTNTNVPKTFFGGIVGNNAGKISNSSSAGELLINGSEFYPNKAPTYAVVVRCAGGIAAIVQDTSEITDTTGKTEVGGKSNLKNELLVTKSEKETAITEAELIKLTGSGLATPTPVPTQTPTETPVPVKKCDMDNNKKVDLADANIILKAALGILSMDNDFKLRADADNNGKIDLADANLVLKVALGITTL